ncbi:CRAL/TRIO domain-containing protein [Clavulina sp. PMI_390]|nr:CRAL/TRIO domain-containing protein [Clavulina sp. PMI_390]
MSAEEVPAPTPAVEPEPQNALTQKFTEKEWAAVKELRTVLPLIFEEAFPNNPDARFRVVDLWGVKIDPGRVDDARVSVVLAKFVRATDLNVQKATERLIATLKWREEFNIEGLLTETFPEDIFGNIGYIFGRDKEGRPLTYNVYGGDVKLEEVFKDLERFLRWRVQLMERAMRQLDFEKADSTVQVHDYAGVSSSSRTEQSKKAAAEATRIFGEHYPECLHVKFFVNVPTFLTWIYWLFKPIVPSKTFAKLHVVGSGPQVIGKQLLPYVDAAELPQAYGGTAVGLADNK